MKCEVIIYFRFQKENIFLLIVHQKIILAIFKRQSPVHLSNQQLLKNLITEYELFISYKNPDLQYFTQKC